MNIFTTGCHDTMSAPQFYDKLSWALDKQLLFHPATKRVNGLTQLQHEKNKQWTLTLVKKSGCNSLPE